MRTFKLAALAAVVAASTTTASPLLNFNLDASIASSPFYQITSKLASWLTSNGGAQAHHAVAKSLNEESGDKTLWQIINHDPHFTQLAHILNYSSDATKELLDGGEKGLTLLAPVNWRHSEHKDVELKDAPLTSHAALAHWSDLESQVTAFEALGDDKDGDDEDKERRRRFIRMLIDATLRYHLVLSKHGALTSEEIAKNSSVASHLHVPESAAKYVGYLLDGEPFRVRTGKSLLPRPSVYFNFYSRLVYPDVRASGDSLLHAISAPLFIPPSALQGLLYGSNEFSTLTTVLYKTRSEGYLSLPIHHRPEKLHAHFHHKDHDDDEHKPPHRPDGPRGSPRGPRDGPRSPRGPAPHDGPHHGPPGQDGPRGNAAFTFFAPSNLAWFKLPPMFKAYLLSPWGERLLSKILMLHAVPSDVLYADAVWHVGGSDKDGKKLSSSSILDATHQVNVLTTYGSTNVSTYVVNSALPKLNHTEALHHEGPEEFEKLTVKVLRYFLLPGGHGPLQTRMEVQGVPITIQDIPAANGVVHLLNAFVKPEEHPEHESVWRQVESEARRLGFANDEQKMEL